MDNKKPVCKLIGRDGNAFAIIGSVRRALKDAGIKDKADEFTEKVKTLPSYDALLCLAMNYVDVE
jgi:hypothetical protein